jgi:hypothetical protein
MDATLLINGISLTVSFTALALTTIMAVRQLRSNRTNCQTANLTQVILKLNSEYRTREFQESEYYVLHRLPAEHKPGTGIFNLPLEAQIHVLRVGHLYADVGMVAALQAVDDDALLGVWHCRVRRTWTALEPYLTAERRLSKVDYWRYFEHLAVRAFRTDKQEILRRQKVQAFPATAEPRVPAVASG